MFKIKVTKKEIKIPSQEELRKIFEELFYKNDKNSNRKIKIFKCQP